MTPTELQRAWRAGTMSSLAMRRAIACRTLAAMGAMGVIALYQLGIIHRLPDPPLPGFDADKVHGSDVAYARLAMPDAALGLMSYAVTFALTAAGGQDRARTTPWLPLALGAKAAFDLAQAGRLLVLEVTRLRALSLWSLVAAGATASAVPLVAREARWAARHLLRQD